MDVGEKPMNDLNKVMTHMREGKPIWVMLPASVVGQLPIGLMGDLAYGSFIVEPAKTEIEQMDELFKKKEKE